MFGFGKDKKDKKLKDAVREAGTYWLVPLKWYTYIIDHIETIVFGLEEYEMRFDDIKVKKEVCRYFQRCLDISTKVDEKYESATEENEEKAGLMKTQLQMNAEQFYNKVIGPYEESQREGVNTEFAKLIHRHLYVCFVIKLYFKNGGNLYDKDGNPDF